MNSGILGREPIELIEILTPRCANTHGSAPCTATETGDAKCFDTRATCNSTDDFQARPLSHLTPERVMAQDETGSVDFDGDDLYIVEIDFQVALDPDGVLFEVGGASDSIYMGFTSGQLIVRCGSSVSTTETDTARVSFDPTAYIGGNYILIGVFERSAGVSTTATAYIFDPVELELTQIGTDTSTTAPDKLFGTTGYGLGTLGSAALTDESSIDYNGRIAVGRMYDNQTVTLFSDQDAYRERYFFDDGRRAKPSDDLYILPALRSSDILGTRINVAAADDRYEPLGRRAYMSCSFDDFSHTDFKYDKYLSDRTYDPITNSTFWPRWMVRNKFGKTRAVVRRYSGYAGDALSAMRTQTYILDRISWSSGGVSIKARDVLSLTEFRKAQVPAPSTGELFASLTDSATDLTLTGDLLLEYPTSGTVRIDDELITYTARALSSGNTNFTGLTRGTDGSTAEAHNVNASAQICRRYTAARIDDVLEEFTITDARIPAQFVDLAKFTSEYNAILPAYTLTTLISEPTGVDQLIGELAEQCAFYIWWNERAQKITLQGIQPLSTVDATWTQDDNIIENTFSVQERPKERISTVVFSYNPRNFADDLDKPTNFENATLISNSEASNADQYAALPQTREIYSRWLTTLAQVNQTTFRLVDRYVDVPQYVTLMVDAKDAELWVGDYVSLEHDYLVDANGQIVTDSRWLIISAEEQAVGHSVKYILADVTLDGRVFTITVNGLGTYTAELFALGNAFITDAAGLNSDTTIGATIG